VESLFDTIREEASRSAWSQGVELARGGAVTREGEESPELVLRVRPASGVVSPSVVLYPADAEWECDCGGDDDPCAHVAAAVIAVRRAEREGAPLPRSSATSGRVRYRLSRCPEGLALERWVVRGREETLLRSTLVALASGRVEGPPVAASQADLAVERALGPRLSGPLPRGILRSLLRALADCPDVRLDNRAIKVSPEPVGMRARLVDAPAGFRLLVERDARIAHEVSGEIAVCDGTLRELAPTGLSGRELHELKGGRVFTPEQVAELQSEILPSLEARMPVVIETDRLPRRLGRDEASPPRLLFDVERDGDRLSVLPTLVYGDPPLARVDAGRLTHLSGPIPVRDEEQEERLLRRLRTVLGLSAGHRALLDANAALEFGERVGRLGAEIRGDALGQFTLAAPLQAELSLRGDGFDLDFSSEGGGTAEPGAVLRAWRHGDSLVPLMGGGFAPLPADWLERFGRRVADLLAARQEDGRIPRCVLPDLARLCDALGEPPPPGFESLARLLDDFAGIPTAPLPDALARELRDYQRHGVDWLCFLRDAELGALLADDMGLGKTLQALCALRGRCLVVVPTSLLANWEDERARFRPELRAHVYHGAGRELDAEADLTLTTYALLRRDRAILAAVEWDAVVLDEAQAIKNPDSQVAQAAFALPARQRMALTGTPIENRLSELWSQLRFLNPGLLGPLADFEERVARPAAAGDAEALDHLRERIRPFVLRRRKSEVARELPPRTDQVLHCVLSEEERNVYDAVRAATVDDVVRQLESGGGVMAALEALLRLRQACCHPGLLPGQEADSSAKLELLRERLETAAADGHKALVFSQWTSLHDRLEPVLADAGIPFVRLDGSTRNRGEVVRRFQDDDDVTVFLISLKAGGTGLNLTSADHVFLLDPWWNPATEEQAADRAHRIGQDKPVFVYRMVAENTVEERILVLQEQKRKLAAAALDGAAAAHSVTRDELLALLR